MRRRVFLTASAAALAAPSIARGERANTLRTGEVDWSEWVPAVSIDPWGHAYRTKGDKAWTNGDKAWFGWPVSDTLEAMRASWIDAPDLTAQKKIADAMQHQWFIDAPMIQTGQWMQPTAHRSDVTDLPPGCAVFWNVRRSA